MKRSFLSADRSPFCSRGPTRALLVGAAALSLCAFGCARQHGYNVDVGGDDEDHERDEGTTDDSVRTDDDARDHEEDSAPVGVAPARPVNSPMSGPSLDEPSIGELMAVMYAEFQRDGSLRCTCHVATGVYATLEECREAAVRQRPSLTDCVDDAIPPDVVQELRTWLRCVTGVKREHNACLEGASCEEQMSCRIASKRCPIPDPARFSGALNVCPSAIPVGP
jgi:hypothetical protein